MTKCVHIDMTVFILNYFPGKRESMARVNFNIQCEMDERWVNQFMSFLKYMEYCGEVGHSAEIAFYSDGDGDFRPHFNTNISYTEEKPSLLKKDITQIPERLYDAG